MSEVCRVVPRENSLSSSADGVVPGRPTPDWRRGVRVQAAFARRGRSRWGGPTRWWSSRGRRSSPALTSASRSSTSRSRRRTSRLSSGCCRSRLRGV